MVTDELDNDEEKSSAVDLSSLQGQASMAEVKKMTENITENTGEENAQLSSDGMSSEGAVAAPDDAGDQLKSIFQNIFEKDTKTILVSNAKAARGGGSHYDVKIKRESLEYTLQSSSNKKIYLWDFDSNDLKIDGDDANPEFRTEFSKRLVSMANDIKAQKAQVLEEKK